MYSGIKIVNLKPCGKTGFSHLVQVSYLFIIYNMCIELCSHILELYRWLSRKESVCNAGDTGFIPGSGRSPRVGHGNPLQYSCLEKPMDKGT